MTPEREIQKRLNLRKPERVYLWFGAALSSAIPMSIGMMLLLPYVNYIKWGCMSSSATSRCQQYFYKGSEPELLEFPIGFTCLFFTPIVCWICCWYVKSTIAKDALEFYQLLHFTIITALKWQIIAGVIHLTFIGIIDWEGFLGAIMIFYFALIFHFFIALIITAPLSLICVVVFRIIALTRKSI